ncbi:MAG: hypothetical protein KDE29_05055 [Anaerolineales bacterium]|nr:hypothetical protein [Anaerolineales bacterium]
MPVKTRSRNPNNPRHTSQPQTHPHAASNQHPDPTAIIQRARSEPQTLTPHDVLWLQRTVGNQAVLQTLGTGGPGTGQTPTIQRKWGSPKKRYDDAITYLNNINAGLGGTVRNNTSRFRDGHRISLGQTGRAITDLGKRDALRALLLCLVAFGLRNQLANAKTEYGAASRADIDDAIQSWWPIDGRGAADIATAAATAPDLGALNLALGRRGTFKTAITCYWTVAYWAFKAGVVSMRFLRDWDEGLNPFKAKDTLLPNPTQYASPHNVPAGHTVGFFIHDYCVHFAVSTGGGMCAGTNAAALGHPNHAILSIDQICQAFDRREGRTNACAVKAQLIPNPY